MQFSEEGNQLKAASLADSAVENHLAAANHVDVTAVSDCGIQVQLEPCRDENFEELRQLREEVKMLRMKCQRTSGMINAHYPISSIYQVSLIAYAGYDSLMLFLLDSPACQCRVSNTPGNPGNLLE